MTVTTTQPAIDLRERIAALDALEARTRTLLRTLEATADGQVRHGPIWKDMLAPLSASGVPAASAPTSAAFGPAGTNEQLTFALNDYCFVLPFHVNHDILPNALAYPHVHWSTGGTQTASVKWELEILRALGHDQANFAASTTIYLEQAAAGTAWRHMVTEASDAQALTLVEPDELVIMTLRRVTNGGTNNTDTVFGLMVDLHYQSATIGTINKSPNFYR